MSKRIISMLSFIMGVVVTSLVVLICKEDPKTITKVKIVEVPVLYIQEAKEKDVIETTEREANISEEIETIEEVTEVDLETEYYYDSLELLAICVEAEAGNQGLEGKRLVADVILNRVNDPDFPNSIEDVITQPYHFSSYWDGAMDRVEPTEETYKAITMELEKISNPSILFFTAGGYGKYGTPWKQVGDHYFCTK